MARAAAAGHLRCGVVSRFTLGVAMSLHLRIEARLGEIATRHGLDAAARDRLEALLAALAADARAPTAVRDPAEAVDVHVADSLAGLDLPPLARAARIADLGSGAGFPGLALAAALPDAEVSLVESSARKCEYLERTVAAVGLARVRVVRSRAEGWGDGLGWADAVTARALAPLPVLAEYAAPLLREGGMLVAWKGRVDGAERDAGARAAGELGLEPREVSAADPFPASRHRSLWTYVKVVPTPSRFPRRPGMARKRPLGRAGARDAS